MPEIVALIVVLGLAAVAGLVHRSRNGRMRPMATKPQAEAHPEALPERAVPVTPTDPARTLPHDVLLAAGGTPGERATLVQFSSSFCQPCRAARLLLGDVAASVPGVTHVEIASESHMDLVRRYDVRRTPTVLVLDGDGRVVRRASGLPRRSDVLAALDDALAGERQS